MKSMEKVKVKLKTDLLNHFRKGETVVAEKVKLDESDQYRKYPLDLPKYAYRLFHNRKPVAVVWPMFVTEI